MTARHDATLSQAPRMLVVDDDRRQILVHALDCSDPAAMVADMKQRYEAPLKEIFG